MTAAAEQVILAELKIIRRTLDEMNAEGKPGFTQAAAARKLKVSVRTLSRRVRRKELRLQDGLVPHSYIRAQLT